MRKLKIGIVGLGNSGCGIHLPILEDMSCFSIHAVCDPRTDKLEEVRNAYSCRGYMHFNDICLDGDIDILVIATLSSLHAEMAIQAMRLGKHVVCEKPMASGFSEAVEMLSVSRETGRVLTVFHNRRLDPGIVFLKRILEMGELGKVYKIQRNVMHYVKRTDWQIWKDKGGGILNNWGTHTIDQAFYLAGYEKAASARLLYSRVDKLIQDGDAEDYSHFILGLGDGMVIEQELSFAAMQKLPDWHIFGDRGAVSIENGRACVDIFTDGEKNHEEYEVKDGWLNDWSEFYHQLYLHITCGARLNITAEQSCIVMKAIDEIKNKRISM